MDPAPSNRRDARTGPGRHLASPTRGASDDRDRTEPGTRSTPENRGLDAPAVLSAAVTALGGDDRPGQHRLAAAVGDAFATGHHLVAEAPTGSGKGLAYLVPAVVSGLKVVVSTATLTLQDQLWNKDLPHLREHGGVSFRAALLKGRSQYLCRAKLRVLLGDDPLLDERPGPTFNRDLERLEAVRRDVGDRRSRRRRHRRRRRAGPRAARRASAPAPASAATERPASRRRPGNRPRQQTCSS